MFVFEKSIENILIKSLGVREGERGLIFYDDYNGDGKLIERQKIVEGFLNISKKLNLTLDVKFIKNSGGNGIEPDISLWFQIFGEKIINKLTKVFKWDEFKSKKIPLEDIGFIFEGEVFNYFPDYVIALTYFSTSHTYFRKLLNNLGTRYVSMPLFDLNMFEGPLSIDFDELERETLALKNKIDGKKSCFIKNNAGTELSIFWGERTFKADTGNLREKGSFGNLPAGEVYIAPVEDKTEGILVIEWGNSGKLQEPLRLFIEKGKVIRLEGDKNLRNFLEGLFSEDDRNNCICELGLGTNKFAKRADNILEAEKIYGTAHVAFGDNITFGGFNKASVHIDYVIFNPEIRWF